MKLTGHADFQLNQAQNFLIEMVATLPVFVPDFLGRFIFVTTPGPTFGLYYGTVSGWRRVGEQLSYFLSSYDFNYFNFDSTDPAIKPVLQRSGIISDIPMPMAGHIIMIEVFSDQPLTVGQFTIKPKINGSLTGSTELDVALSTVHPSYFMKLVSADNGNFDVAQGDLVSLQIEGSPGTIPALLSVSAIVHIMLPIVLEFEQTYDTHEFHYFTLLPSQTKAAYAVFAPITGFYATKSGYMLTHSAVISPARTAGSITVVPTIDGTPVTDTRLNLALDGSNPLRHYATVPASDPAFFFNAGDFIGTQIVSDGALIPVTGIDISSFISVMHTI